LTDKQVEEIMQKADTDKNQKLSIEEFNKPEGFNKLRAEGEKAKDKLSTFTTVDGDEDGVLDIKEL
jgi:Ca2+-binding EF-hand superfamily protein